MVLATAFGLFKDINNDGFTELEKGRAIQIVMDAETHNSITKADMLRVIRWLWNMVFEETTTRRDIPVEEFEIVIGKGEEV